MIASFFVGNVMLLILNLPLVGLWARILHLPYQYVCVGTLLFCVIGAYSLQQSVFDVGVMIACGIIGYGMRKIDLPIAPLVLGLILGPFIEKSLRTSLEMSAGDFSIFFTRPLCLGLLILAGARPRSARRCGCAPSRSARGIDRLRTCNQQEERHMLTLRNDTLLAPPWRWPPPSPAPSRAGLPHQADPADGRLPARRLDRHRRAHRRRHRREGRSASRSSSSTRAAPAARSAGPKWSRQKPDGYYIGFINLPATNTVILDPERKAIFTEKDFTPIINQVLDPGVIWVRADSPYKTVQDLIDAAKKAPSTIRAATTGILSDDHLAILMTEEAAPGAIFRIVHLEGGAAQFKEIMAGNIDVAFDNVGSIVPRVKIGRGARARRDR